MRLRLNPRLFSPLHWHLMPLLRDPAIRYIFIEGGSSAAKTFEICRALALDMLEHNYSTMVFRRFGVDINDSVYSSFKAASRSVHLDQFLTNQQHLIKFNTNDGRIRFRGLDDEENIKGIEGFNVVYNNEWSQFQEHHWDQQRKRLRGRANQKFICDWNPVSAKLWFYENWLDTFEWTDLPLDMPNCPSQYSGLNAEFAFKKISKKGDAVWIKVTYRDNFWVVGHPSGEGGFRDQATIDDFERDRLYKPNLYRVYANGERGIMRTGGEFFKQFDETRHVRPMVMTQGPLHVSLDENVNPYVTVSLWQVDDKEVRQVDELPCKTPDNNAPKAAQRLVRWMLARDFEDVIYIYGDPSARKRSTVDENSASFYDKFIEVLQRAGFHVINRVGKSAPQVALSASFINDIYEQNLYGYSIAIADRCKSSVEDYCVVKEAPDGTMVKEKVKDPTTGVSYEPQGHFSDAKRYFITTLLTAEFNRYKARSRKGGVMEAPRM